MLQRVPAATLGANTASHEQLMRQSLEKTCPCGSEFPLAACCAPFIRGLGLPPTATATMRSRYTAFVLNNRDYLLDTWHASTRPNGLLMDTDRQWLGLSIKLTEAGDAGDASGLVEFVARFKVAGRAHRIHERSRFQCEEGRWYYVDGDRLE